MTFKIKVVAGFGTGLALLVLIGVLSLQSLNRNAEDRAWVTHTHLAKERLDAVLADLLDTETGQRGYIITGESSYLQPYAEGLARVRQNVKELRELTADNPVQQKLLDGLEESVASRLSQLTELIDTRTRKGLLASIEEVREGAGKQTMDRIRTEIAGLRTEEDRLLTVRSGEADASARATRIVIVGGAILAVGLLSLAGIVVAKEMEQRSRAEQDIRELNVSLERRVEERTAQLAERARDLARSNTELQQFAYVASHDLQEPLRMVASFTQLLAKRYKDKLDQDAQDFIHYAVDGATRMQTLISDLLNYSRVGTQGKPLVPTDSEAMFQRVLQSLQFSIEESSAAISHDPLPQVMGDPQQLGQLFQNLLTNAIKFRGKEPPRIRVSAERDDGKWKISVHDNGIGISQDHADRIFVIFQRLHTKTEYPGTGIGLAICKKIVERHGGRIWIEPSQEGGTTFCFTISAAEKQKNEREGQNELRTAVYAR